VTIVDDENVHKYLARLEGRPSKNPYEAIAGLEALGADVPGLLLKKYKVSRRWSDRATCVFHCIEYAKTNEDAYQLGIIALQDKSKTVRRRACKLLSAAQRQEAIEHLQALITNEASNNDARIAIEALQKLERH